MNDYGSSVYGDSATVTSAGSAANATRAHDSIRFGNEGHHGEHGQSCEHQKFHFESPFVVGDDPIDEVGHNSAKGPDPIQILRIGRVHPVVTFESDHRKGDCRLD